MFMALDIPHICHQIYTMPVWMEVITVIWMVNGVSRMMDQMEAMLIWLQKYGLEELVLIIRMRWKILCKKRLVTKKVAVNISQMYGFWENIWDLEALQSGAEIIKMNL